MSKAKKNLITAIVSAIILTLTIAVYLLLPYEKADIDKLIFFHAIAAELLACISILFCNCVSDKNRLALAAGGYTISVLYIVLFAGASLLFGIYYRNAMTAYRIIFSVFTALFIAAVILIYFGGKEVSEKTKDTESACLFFKKLEYKVESLYENAVNGEIAKKMHRIQDAIKSCDQSSKVETDELISQGLDEMKELLCAPEIDESKVSEIFEKIMRLIKQRGAEIGQMKMGGI